MPVSVGAGLGGLALGGVGLALDGEADRDVEVTHIALNFAVGLTAALLGVRTLLAEPTAASTSDSDRPDAQAFELHFSPWAPMDERGGAGVLVGL